MFPLLPVDSPTPVVHTFAQPGQQFVIKDSHRGLYYENGRLIRVLEAGRYRIPKRSWWASRLGDPPVVECVLVDVRQRELTIKGQEILTADKVAIRVSILVQFRVIDPEAAVHVVDDFEDRLYSDVQLAARRSLASMNLDTILTNRNQLSEDILSDVTESAAGYGVAIRRADVKDLVFPGNLQEVMNRVLAAQRQAEAQLVEARTQAEVEKIEAASRAETMRLESASTAEARRQTSQAEAEATRAAAEAAAQADRIRGETVGLLEQHPALLRLAELETLRQLAHNAKAHLHIATEGPHLNQTGSDQTRTDPSRVKPTPTTQS